MKSASSFGNATALQQVTEEDDFGAAVVPLEFHCKGTPPSFEVVYSPPEESATWIRNLNGTADGAVWIQGGTIRPTGWKKWGHRAVATSVHRREIESIAESGGVLDIEVHAPNGETLHYRSPESSGFVSALRRFLVQCGRHAKEANRQFEIDGIHVDLQVEVDEKRLEDIRALAAELGIRDLESIYVGLYGHPMPFLVAIVESRAVQQGDQIAQCKLYLKNKDWLLGRVNPDDSVTTRGSWQTSPQNLVNLDRWIVRDGDWSIEVRLGDEVPYEDAERILWAIRRGTVVYVGQSPVGNWSRGDIGPQDLKKTNERTVPRIQIDDDAGESGRYEVHLPRSSYSGTILEVRVLGDRVEVLSVGSWIS